MGRSRAADSRRSLRSERLHSGSSFEALEARQLLSGATDDRFEDNDLPRTVVRAAEGAANSPNLGAINGQRVIRNLKLCDNADVFRFRLLAPATTEHLARINFNASRGDLDLQLFAANGTRLLRQSIRTGGPETINLGGLATGAFYLKIVGKNGAQNANYTLTINAPTQIVSNPNEDAYEDNDTMSAVSSAAAGAANSPNLGSVPASRALAGLKLNDTYDIFKFSIASTVGAATPKFIRIDSGAPLNLVLYSNDGTSLRNAAAYLGQNTIDLTGLNAGEYFVQVTHYALGTAGVFNYGLNFNV